MRLIAYRVPASLSIGVAALLLGGCNSSDDGGSGSNPTTQSASGVWSGTDSVSGDTVVAIINADGTAAFIRSDGLLFTGTAQVSGNTLAVTVDGYPDFPETFADGSTTGLGTLNGTVMTTTSLSAALTFTTSDNTSITGTWSLNYLALPTGTLAGTYTDAVTGATVTVSSSGLISATATALGCVLNGQATASASADNVYGVTYTYTSCTGAWAVLNGVQFSGEAYVNSNVSPEQVTVGVSGASSTEKYGIISVLNGS